MDNYNEVWDYDTEFICDPADFPVIEEGDYDFTVTKVERANYAGGEKLPACPQLVVYMDVTNGVDTVSLRDNFYVHPKMKNKFSRFFFSVFGPESNGIAVKPSLVLETVGMKGRCHVSKGIYKGHENNNVDRYIEKASNPTAGFTYSNATPPQSFTQQPAPQQAPQQTPQYQQQSMWGQWANK